MCVLHLYFSLYLWPCVIISDSICAFKFLWGRSWADNLHGAEYCLQNVTLSWVSLAKETWYWDKDLFCMGSRRAAAHTHSTHMNKTCVGLSHVTYMEEFCHTWEGVLSHIWRVHVAHVVESWLCYVTHVVELRHTYGRVASHRWRSHVKHMEGSCHTYGGVTSHIWRSHITHIWRSQVAVAL